RIEQRLNQRTRRVVAAGGLALVAGRSGEREGPRVDVHLRVEFQQRFVHAAEFLRAEVFVIDGAQAANGAIFREGERANSVEQVAVGDLAADDIRDRLVAEQEASKHR